MSGSLPFGYDNLGQALENIAGSLPDTGYAPPEDNKDELDDTGSQWLFKNNRAYPRGTFYDKDGNPREFPPCQGKEPPTRANQHGWLLNAYGETGNRLVWLTYTRSAARAQF